MANSLDYYRRLLEETALSPPLIDGDGDSLENDIVLDVGTNSLVLEVTEEQYIQMLSALWNGAYQTYPLDYISVVYPLIKAGKLEICDAILDCIETDGDIQNAIASFSDGAGIDAETPENPTILETDLFGVQAPCDNDQIYGMCLQMTQMLNQVSEDVLELFVTAFAVPGRIGDIIEAIPGLGILPFDDLLQFFEKMAETINDAYQASYDTQIEEDISCALFCLATANCQLTFEMARDYFQSQLLEAVTNDDFPTIVNDMLANNWLGEQSIWVLHWFLMDAMIFGTEVLGIDSGRMLTTVATYLNDPNSDWDILCTECGWTETWLNGDGDPTVDGWDLVWGTYDGGNNRLNEEDAGGSSDYVLVDFFIPADKTGVITEFSYNYSLKTPTNRTSQIAIQNTIPENVQIEQDVFNGTHSGTFTIDTEVPFEEGYRLYCFVTVANNAGDHYGRITQMTVKGTGDNPFE